MALHMQPEHFERLTDDVLRLYAETFDISIEELRNFRETLKSV